MGNSAKRIMRLFLILQKFCTKIKNFEETRVFCFTGQASTDMSSLRGLVGNGMGSIAVEAVS
jgi:hypothetical protein